MAQYNVEINRYNGSSYDALFPKTKTDNLTGILPVSKGGTGANTLTPAIGTHGARAIYAGGALMTDGVSALTTGAIYLQCNLVYGASWAGTSSPVWTRTDDSASFGAPNPAVNNGNGSSPFDNISPWKDMVIVDDSVCGKCVKIPKFYFKWTQLSPGLKLQISMTPFAGSAVCPACMDRGDGYGERDYVLVGRYHSASSKKSVSGQMPAVGNTRKTARNAIHSLGTNVWQWDWATRVTIQMLYLVEFANWDSQAMIGYGCGNNSSAVAVGQTDAMAYHTGTSAASRTAYGYCQYRHIEGLWDNVYDWMDGCYYNESGMNVILNPASFSDSSGGILNVQLNQGQPMITSGYPSALTVSNNTPWAIYPSASSGSDSTFVCDNWDFNGSNPVLYAGASWGQSQRYGLFYVYSRGAGFSYANLGYRLLKLP